MIKAIFLEFILSSEDLKIEEELEFKIWARAEEWSKILMVRDDSYK